MEKIYYNKITGLLCNRYPTDIKLDENSAYIEVSEEIANTTYVCPFGKHWAVVDNTLQQVDYETEESKQLKISNEIAKYKDYLSSTDYVIAKLNELKLEDDEEFEKAKIEYKDVLAKRKEARNKINELEGASERSNK